MVASHRGEMFVCVFYFKGSHKYKSHIVEVILSVIEEVDDKVSMHHTSLQERFARVSCLMMQKSFLPK